MSPDGLEALRNLGDSKLDELLRMLTDSLMGLEPDEEGLTEEELLALQFLGHAADAYAAGDVEFRKFLLGAGLERRQAMKIEEALKRVEPVLRPTPEGDLVILAGDEPEPGVILHLLSTALDYMVGRASSGEVLERMSQYRYSRNFGPRVRLEAAVRLLGWLLATIVGLKLRLADIEEISSVVRVFTGGRLTRSEARELAELVEGNLGAVAAATLAAASNSYARERISYHLFP